MSKAERTRQFIIEQTAPLFNKKGVAATSLNDMLEVTGLTKGSIYGNFENKEEVAMEAYRYNVSRLKDSLYAHIGAAEDPLNQLNAIVAFYREQGKMLVQTGGCPMLNTAAEADDSIPELLKEVQHSFRSLIRRIAAIIRKGQETGQFCRDVSADDYSQLFVMLIEGGILLSNSFRSRRYLELALEKISAMIDEEISQ